jgi:hypothetical protein
VISLATFNLNYTRLRPMFKQIHQEGRPIILKIKTSLMVHLRMQMKKTTTRIHIIILPQARRCMNRAMRLEEMAIRRLGNVL